MTSGPGDQWLLHEVEDGFRDSNLLEDHVHNETIIRNISGNSIIYFEYGGRVYSWLSVNNVVIKIDGGAVTNPEPIEIVQAYLAKYPSTIMLTNAELKSHAHSVLWLRDEMERRVWLAEKWVPLAKTDASKIDNVVKSLKIFLKYREKYLGKSAKTDLADDYKFKQAGDVASLEKKVISLRKWWNDHKTDSLSNVP